MLKVPSWCTKCSWRSWDPFRSSQKKLVDEEMLGLDSKAYWIGQLVSCFEIRRAVNLRKHHMQRNPKFFSAMNVSVTRRIRNNRISNKESIDWICHSWYAFWV